jgi:hypothetical protein
VIGHPPAWFFDVYDSMILNVPLFAAASIRQIPIYIRWRMRLVHELMREARMTVASKNKAMGVYDFSQF